MLRKWLNKQLSRLICLFKGCDARTGYHYECLDCPAYDMEKENCDII